MSFIDELKAQDIAKNKIELRQLEELKEKAFTAMAEFNVKCIKDEILEKAKSSTDKTISGYREIHLGKIPFEGGRFDNFRYNACDVVFEFNGPIINHEEIEDAGYKYTFFSPSNTSIVFRAVNFLPTEKGANAGFLKSLFSRYYYYSLGEQAKNIIDKIVIAGHRDGIAITPLYANQQEDKLGIKDTLYIEFDVPAKRPTGYLTSYISLKYEVTY